MVPEWEQLLRVWMYYLKKKNLKSNKESWIVSLLSDITMNSILKVKGCFDVIFKIIWENLEGYQFR